MTVDIGQYAPHLRELRRRLVVSVLAITLASGVAYFFSKQISHFFIQPLFVASPDLERLVYTNLPEAFFSYLKLSLLVGIGVSFPVVVYQAWAYAAPGLHKHEKKISLAVVVAATGLFAAGVFFSIFAVLPVTLKFFMGFARENLTPMPKFGAYLTFVARTALAFGLSFEIPFLMVVTVRLGLIDKKYFSGKRLYFYGVIAVLAFLLCAGDFIATMLLALPLILLYEAGNVVALILGSNKKNQLPATSD